MDIIFNKLPESLEEMKSTEYASLAKPEYTVALFIATMCVYTKNKDEALKMLEFLKGPYDVNEYQKQFLRDRMRGADYLPFSFFNGATPDNDYSPSLPYIVTVNENLYSYQEENYAKLFVKSGGADSARPITMRLKPSTGEWFLNEQLLLAGIRIPKSSDPWA